MPTSHPASVFDSCQRAMYPGSSAGGVNAPIWISTWATTMAATKPRLPGARAACVDAQRAMKWPTSHEKAGVMHVGNFTAPWLMLRDKRILVVEDEALVAMLIEDELLEAGARVVGPAASAGEALRLIETAADGGLSAAVLDINLAGEAVRPVADRLAALGVPFLFATGYGEGCDTGGHATARVLRKPFGPRTLIDAVEALASAGEHRRAPWGAVSRRS